MPTWVTPVFVIATAIFSSGVTWGILSFRQRKSEEDQSDIVKDLKECVSKLQGVVTEVEVMKVANARYERQSDDHDKRIASLEIKVAQHIDRSRRKR